MRIGIAGSGASATLVAAALERTVDDLELFCFDDRPLGSSLAFETTSRSVECNTSESVNVSFLRRLGVAHPAADPGAFPPRYTVGLEVAQTATRLRALAKVELHDRLGQVARATHDGEGITVRPRGGAAVTGLSRLYLCRGLHTPKIPEDFTPIAAHPDVVTHPYPIAATADRLAGRHVLVVGSNLSAVEIALELTDRGGTVVMASRDGILPSVRRLLPDDPVMTAQWQLRLQGGIPSRPESAADVFAWHARRLGRPFPTDDPESFEPLALLEKEIAACADDRHWSGLIIPLSRVLNQWPEAARTGGEALEGPPLRRFTNAVPLDTACRLQAAMAAGSVTVTTIDPIMESGDLDVFREGGSGDGRFGAVVLACGWEQPAPVPGIPDRWVCGHPRDDDSGPWVVPIGIEAYRELAVPNALFAAEAQLARLLPSDR